MLSSVFQICIEFLPVWNAYLIPILCLCFVAWVPRFIYFIVRGD